MTQTVAIGGLGAIGLKLARALDAGVDGLQLVAVAARDRGKAEAHLSGFHTPPRVVSLPELAEADIVVEAAPAAVFEPIATAAIEGGRVFVPASVGALLPRMHLVERAKETGARIVVPTGALLGLDAVRAAAEGAVASVTIESRKPPRGLEGAPYLVRHGIDEWDHGASAGVRRQCVRCGCRISGERQCRRGTCARRHWSDAHARGDLGRSRHQPQRAYNPRGSRGGALQHDNRKCAERGEPAHRTDHGAVDAGVPEGTGGDA
jgi:hypothetical protein